MLFYLVMALCFGAVTAVAIHAIRESSPIPTPRKP